MIPKQYFTNSIDGKTLYDFKKKLDYKLETFEERLELVNKIFYTYPLRLKDENGNPIICFDNFFAEYFDNYYNPHLGSTTEIKDGKSLAEDEPVCAFLSQVAKYLDDSLMTKDEIKKRRKLKQDIKNKETQSDNIYFNSSMRDDGEIQSLRDINAIFEFSEKEIPPFGGNYKKQIKQKIFKSDLEKLPVLCEYQKAIDGYKGKLNPNLPYRDFKTYLNTMCSMKDDQKRLKDDLLGTIYFKNVLPDNGMTNYTCFELDLFNIDDCKILLKLISFEKVYFQHDYISMYKILKSNIKFTDKELDMLDVLEKGKENRYEILERENNDKSKKRINIYKDCIYNITDLANELKISVSDTYRTYNTIAEKISDAYVEWYEDNIYYIKKVKGKYKRCSRCGEVKLLHRFYEEPKGKDGRKNICINCLNE